MKSLTSMVRGPLELAQRRKDSLPVYLAVGDMRGPFSFQLEADTLPLVEEIHKNICFENIFERMKLQEFLANNSSIGGIYYLLTCTRQTSYETFLNALEEDSLEGVTLAETLAFIRAYPEWVEWLGESGPAALGSAWQHDKIWPEKKIKGWGIPAIPFPIKSYHSLQPKWPCVGHNGLSPVSTILAKLAPPCKRLGLDKTKLLSGSRD